MSTSLASCLFISLSDSLLSSYFSAQPRLCVFRWTSSPTVSPLSASFHFRWISPLCVCRRTSPLCVSCQSSPLVFSSLLSLEQPNPNQKIEGWLSCKIFQFGLDYQSNQLELLGWSKKKSFNQTNRTMYTPKKF